VRVNLTGKYTWTPLDTAQEKARVREADDRVASWARWQRSHGINLDYPPESAFVRVMRPSDVEEQAGARHLAVDPPDDEAMQVDGIIARWRIQHVRRYKILRTEFLYHAPASVKAHRHGMSRLAWRQKVDQVLSYMADELGIP